jgi:cytochrome c-type biogenesis protein CcsB
MEKFSKALFSMRMMAVAMFVFLAAIGIATILESKYDIQTAKIIVYNAKWFEILLVYLSFNLIANIFRHQMYKREKIALFTFHASFIIIIIGAALTRYIGFEGLMLIPEGQSVNYIYSSEPHFWFRIHDGKMQVTDQMKVYMSEITDNSFKYNVEFPGKKNPITIEYVDFKKKQIDTLLINDSIRSSVLDIVSEGKKSNYLQEKNFIMLGSLPITFDVEPQLPGIEIRNVNGNLMMISKVPVAYLPMSEMQKFRQSGMEVPDSLYKTVPTDSLVPFQNTTLYVAAGEQFVFTREIKNATMTRMSSGKKDVGMDVLTVRVSDGNSSKEIELEGGMSAIPGRAVFEFSGLSFEMEYGSVRIDLPFSILCRDFQLEKYPGSETASSFASEVTVQDPKNNVNKEHRIFMNNVMDYGGYRFFQSSYDLDNPATPENEEGTRLSVNYDWWGTNVTYLGYLLMSIAMILSLFAPVGRFKDLLSKLKKSHERRDAALKMLLVACLSIYGTTYSFSQTKQEHDTHEHHDHEHDHDHDDENHNHVSKSTKSQQKLNLEYHFISSEHSDAVASLLAQDFDGRIVPFHTVSDQLLRKIYGAKKYNDKNAVQVVLSMHLYPEYWITQPVISIPKAVRERLKLGNYASFQDLNDQEKGEFRWMKEYNEAHQKLESKRSEFDKKIIKLVERFQVLNSVLSWQYLKIMPLKNSENNLWVHPLTPDLMMSDSVIFKRNFEYFSAVHQASKDNKWGVANDLLTEIKAYQREVGKEVVPSETHVKVEVSYNKMDIFKNAMRSYFVLGIILLILFFVRIFVEPTLKSEKRFKRIAIPFIVLISIIFLYHGYGLGMRWYISGHAPWSNGYEAVVFIAWVTMLAGIIFARKNPVILAATAILAFFMIFVTEMNLMDPEITPLQPVLKSYWLMIHVAVITGSYGFLGLAAILGFINLSLYIFRGEKNGNRLTAHINEISYVSELTMTIGLFMLTIGTFLGGIWANESWGRYWGWDPKETWALVSVLVYAIILHLRYIPGLNGKFTFNLVSFWGYSAIIFTFFGVNFYLVGLHSYAQGEGLAEIPSWIYWTIISFASFSLIAFIRFKQYSKKLIN